MDARSRLADCAVLQRRGGNLCQQYIRWVSHSLCNNLAKALQDEDMTSVEEVLGFLEDYTVKHFGTELALMKEYKYPFMKEHMEDHARFIKRVGSLKEELISESQDKLYS